MRRPAARDRSGFTLLEMSVALVLLVLVIGNVYSLLRQSSKAIGAQNSTFDIDTQAQRAMDHITMAIVGASDATLTDKDGAPPVSEPFSMSTLLYKESLGVQDGTLVTSPQQRIEYTNTTGEVTWIENKDTPDEKRVVWSKNIPPAFLQEEIANGVDDNRNGIIDETGLSFVKDGKSVTVYLTVKRTTPDGEVHEKKLQETVTCRN